MRKTIVCLILISISFQAESQSRRALIVSGGIGSFINSHDVSLLNYYNPRRYGQELAVKYAKERDNKVGWDIGIAFRSVRYFTLAVFPSSLGIEADTSSVKSHFNFIVIPANLHYSKRLKNIQLIIKAGAYVGWKTLESEIMTSQQGIVFSNTSGNASSRFPVLDATGLQAGLEINYYINNKWAAGITGTLLKDASEFIYKENSWPHHFNGYGGRLATFQIKRYLQ